VDDAPESLRILSDTLTAAGYDVCAADSGELALSSLAGVKPELILLGLRMAGMDGFELCRRLKARSETRDVPLIIISATTDTKERVQGFRLGAVDFVSKPFQKEELLARIGTHLELSRFRSGLEEMAAERTAHVNGANRRLLRELTDRIHAEQALRESEERFRTMANNAPAVIWTTGPDAKTNFVNQYALTFTGRTFEELVGLGWKDLMHPEDFEHKALASVLIPGVGREYRMEYRVRRADGEYRWMLDTATARFLEDGSFAGYIGIAMDITEVKRNQEQILAAQKLESLGVLVSGLAHNFNNLMGAIIAEADLALSELPEDSAAYGNVERINATAIRAADIVFMLTAYANPGPAGLLTSVNVSSVVAETLNLLKATVARNIAFQLELAPKLPSVRADTSHIRQVVMNLLTNACESLPNQEGTVFVNTSCVRIGTQDWSNQVRLPAGDYVLLSVTDSGCGISAEVRSRIFDPFYTTKFLGRGLGLAAVQGIVRSLGGAINVQSVSARGSSFEVLLPCMNHDGCSSGDPDAAVSPDSQERYEAGPQARQADRASG